MTILQIVLMMAAVYNIALAVLVLVHTHTYRAGRPFAWYLFAIAAWLLVVTGIQPHYADTWNLACIHATFSCVTGILISWVWFCAEFPRPSISFRRIAAVITVLSLPWFFIPWTGLIVPGLEHSTGMLNVVIGPLFVPYFIWIFLAMPVSIIHLVRMMKRVSNVERLQIRYILLGTIAMIVCGSIPTLFLPVFAGSSAYASYAPLTALCVTTATTYVIIRSRLMDIRLVIRAGIAFTLTIGVLALFYAAGVPLLDCLLHLLFDIHRNVSSFVIAFLLALLYEPMLQWVRRALDARLFTSAEPDQRLALQDACTLLTNNAPNRERIAQDFAVTLTEMYAPRRIAIYIPGHNNRLTQVFLAGNWPNTPKLLSMEDRLVFHLLAADEILVADELLRQPAPAHAYGTHLNGWNADVAVPLLAGQQVCGLVLLGEKLSGDVYTSDDLGLLRILGKQAAIALINARHFDEMVLLNEYHERLLNTMQDGVLAIDPQGQVLTCNPAAATILGVAAPAALAGSLDALGLGELPRPTAGAASCETTLCTPRGAAVPVQVTVTPFWRRWETAPCYLLVVRDLSALRALERDKLQAERYSSMGAMAASLAHEIKNPLVPIQTFAHLLPTKYDDGEFREAFSQTVVREVDRIAQLVGQVLDLARKSTGEVSEARE